MLAEPNELKQNPFFIDLMLRRLLLRAAMLEEPTLNEQCTADERYVEIMSKSVDDYPEWVFTSIEATD